MSEISELDATSLVQAFKEKLITPSDVLNDVVGRYEKHKEKVNAFVGVDYDAARRAASQSTDRWARGRPKGLLDGIIFTVKDNLLVRNWPTRRGSSTTSEDPESENAPAVDRMLEQGAVLLGKTTMPEFGWAGTSHSPLTGITANPWDDMRMAGGSSAGASVAAAYNLGQLHLGTDGGGSIRIPSAFCGVFGLKPTFGRVAAYPPSPFIGLLHVGPITRTVRDSALMLKVITGPDERDPAAKVFPQTDFQGTLDEGVRGLRLAWSPRLGYVHALDKEIGRVTQDAAFAFKELGASVVEADPGFEDPIELLRPIWGSACHGLLASVPEHRHEEMDPEFVALAKDGVHYTARDLGKAADGRARLAARMEAFHREFDLLLTPQLPLAAFSKGVSRPTSEYPDWFSWSPFTYPFNLSQQPAASVPCGRTSEGLPVGLQLVGPKGREDLILRAARAFEKIRPFSYPSLSVS